MTNKSLIPNDATKPLAVNSNSNKRFVTNGVTLVIVFIKSIRHHDPFLCVCVCSVPAGSRMTQYYGETFTLSM